MATIRENYETEIARRQNTNTALEKAAEDTEAAIAQFEELEAAYKTQLSDSRVKLEAAYLEDRHYTGKWPIVYDETIISKYPFFGETDDLCNAYFPISLIKAGTEKGIAPAESLPTRTTGGSNVRDRDHTPKEDVPRGAASTALAAYPDTSEEPTAESCSDPFYTDQTSCELNGETWGYFPGDSAPTKLSTALNAWKSDIQAIITDIDSTHTQVYNNPIIGSDRTVAQYWQDIIDEIDACIGLLPGDPTPPSQTPAASGGLLTAITNLIAYADTHVPALVTARSGHLQTTTTEQETAFFGVIKLRLHQVNGSFSKLKAISDQVINNAEIIADNEQAIADILKLISLL